MSDARRLVVRCCLAAVVTVALVAAPTPAVAAPGGRLQEDPGEDDRSSRDRVLVDADDVLAQDNPAAFTGALEDLNGTVSQQLTELQAAEGNVLTKIQALSEADAAVQETEFRIEELNTAGDQIVADAFVSPPTESRFELLSADTVTDAAVKQQLLSMQTDTYANALEELDVQRERLEAARAEQRDRLADAEAAQADAEAALADLESSVSQQAQFVLDVREWLAGQREEAERAQADNPQLAEQIRARQAEVAAQLQAAEEAAAYAEALRRLEEEQERREAAGRIVCPVQGNVQFTDTWGAPRSGGRSHKGVDMMAAHGTPTVAPTSGRVVHRGTSLGGLSWYVYGDNGHTYYGTHLQSYANQGVGHVEAGTLIGYVGSSGNADSSAPHLHFEYQPNGGASINPYPLVDEACPDH